MRQRARSMWVWIGLAAAGLSQGEPALPKCRPVVVSDEAATAAAARQLCTAIDAGDDAAVARALVAGASPNVGMGAGDDDTGNRRPLVHAVLRRSAVLVDLLLAHGARLERGDAGGHTPLMYAARQGDAAMVAHLVQRGARLGTTDQRGTTVFQLEVPEGPVPELLGKLQAQEEALLAALAADDGDAAWRTIAEGASPNGNDGERCALILAVRRNEAARVRELLAKGARADLLLIGGLTATLPLAVAAEHGDLAMLRLLIEVGKPGPFGLDCALAAAAGADAADRLARVHLLLAAGADPARDIGLEAPALAAAARHGDLPTMAALLAAGADQAAADQALLRAAGLAAAAQPRRVVQALLDAGANADTEWFGATALGTAARDADPELLQLLFAKVGKEVFNNAVLEAARNGHADGLRWLLEHGKSLVDFTFASPPFEPALPAAIENGRGACVEALLAAGADANQAPGVGWDAPLLAALQKGDRALVAMLLKAGADPRREHQAPLGPRQTALAVARELGDAELLQLLEGHLAATALEQRLTDAGLHAEAVGNSLRLRFEDSGSGRHQDVYVRRTVEAWEALAGNEPS